MRRADDAADARRLDLDAVITSGLIGLFSHPGSALLLSGAIFACGVGVLATTWARDVRPLASALWNRRFALDGVTSRRGGPAVEFAAAFDEVDKAMMASGARVYALQRAWLDYRQTFVQLDADVLSTSSRAGYFFDGAGDPGRSLEWWANIFVAIGLLFTFLGIVAALSQATAAITAGGGAGAMQAALGGLLGIAAAKFWTSVAGIGASLMLRLFGRRWRDGLERREDELCESLDACVTHISPQRIALLQLEELRRIATRLEAA